MTVLKNRQYKDGASFILALLEYLLNFLIV